MTPLQIAFDRWWHGLPVETREFLFAVLAAQPDAARRRDDRIYTWDHVFELRPGSAASPGLGALLGNVARQARNAPHRTHRPIVVTMRADGTLPGSPGLPLSAQQRDRLTALVEACPGIDRAA